MASRSPKKPPKLSLRHFFLPHPANGRQPHLLRKEVVGGALAFVILIELAALFQAVALPNSPGQLSAVLPAVVVSLTNGEREDNRLGSLATNPLLTKAAQDVANNMAERGYFSHVSPDGKTPWYWLGLVGYQYQYAGENLAINFDDSQQLLNAWMSSPTHRENILGPNYTQIGVAMASGTYQGQSVVFVVQYFASPLVASPSVQAPPAIPSAALPAPKLVPTGPTVAAVHTSSASIAQMSAPLAAAIMPVKTAAPISLWDEIMTSPNTYATDVLLVIAAFFALLLGLSLTPLSMHFLHPRPAVNGLALVAVILGILVLNKTLLFKQVSLPPDVQNAAVAMSTR